MKEDDSIYPKDFTAENRMVGVLWSTKRDSGLWFGSKDWRECRVGIQLLPLLPVSEILFSDVKFVKQLVSWTSPALGRGDVGEGWKGFVYALEGVYDKDEAIEKIREDWISLIMETLGVISYGGFTVEETCDDEDGEGV